MPTDHAEFDHPVRTEFVEDLRRVFPRPAPSLSMSLREYDEAAGIERVLAFLERISQRKRTHVSYSTSRST